MGWSLVREKREWVPEWLFAVYAKIIPCWVFPFRQIFTAPVHFKPGVFYNEELRLTEILLEDAPTVWVSWGPYKGHAVDCGYHMDDGRLVGVKIWDDVRVRQRKGTPL